jgi:Cu(I)/Ag(I) efflux system membrane protein CusA/SilA
VLSLLIPLAGIGGLLAPLKWPFQAADAVTTLVGWGEERTPAKGAQGLQSHSGPIATIEAWQQGLADAWRDGLRGVPVLEDWHKGLGSEFMPDLYEGDLMYMPTTLPGLSIGKGQELLQQTDRLIATLPEVERVFGKIGRADTATDPAPLTMIETLIQLKPEEEWRPGMTIDALIDELDATVDLPGVTNAWVMPIKTRIDMLATGIKTPVGVKIAGPDLKEIERIGQAVERAVMQVEGTTSAFSERVAGGRYVEIRPGPAGRGAGRAQRQRHQQVVAAAIGGINVTQTVEGLERYPVNIRFPREQRDDVQKLRELPIVTPTGAQVPLAQVAEVVITDGAPMLKSENARLNGWTFVDIRGRDLGSWIDEARQVVASRSSCRPATPSPGPASTSTWSAPTSG